MILAAILTAVGSAMTCTTSTDIQKCLTGNVRYLEEAKKEVEKLKWEVINEKIPMYHKGLG